ncbi:hypothetical protein OG250_23585 [Streptomyces sp. NBC_00487]|uniref:hypothetical protein n=1 Tax=unclassified Streptomyces TaxID=2593676 RepID=UPI002DDAE156|nr:MULTISPECIES: hypothetical protein [unclassified Streptomyces]WRY97573.1 hypothetical protein OG889_24380 [Streptomyces sp. NBC_00481]
MKKLAALAMTGAIVGGSLLVTTTAAAAEEIGSWKPYGDTNPITSSSSTWSCNSSREIAPNVVAQVCSIRSPKGGSVQGAVIVRNNNLALFSTTAEVDLVNATNVEVGYWKCRSSGVGPKSWSVCFGDTRPYSGWVNSGGLAGGISLGISPGV